MKRINFPKYAGVIVFLLSKSHRQMVYSGCQTLSDSEKSNDFPPPPPSNTYTVPPYPFILADHRSGGSQKDNQHKCNIGY